MQEQVWSALKDVKDPEIPTINVVDLGLIEAVQVEGGQVTVQALPTFTGCPALGVISADIERRLKQLPGVAAVRVEWRLSPPWTAARISAAGREMLRQMGIAPPGQQLTQLDDEPVFCPFCGSPRVEMQNLFGPTACRSIYYCRSCKNPFEKFKEV